MEDRRVTATATVGGSSGSVSTIDVLLGLNAYPYVTIKFHQKGSGGSASKILNTEMIAALAEAQRGMFAARTAPDMTAQFSDGKGGEMNFQGFSSRPGYTVGMGGVAQLITGIHPSSMMDGLNLSIYTAPGIPIARAKVNSKAGSWAVRLAELTKGLIEKWQSLVSSTGDDATIKNDIHNQNQLFLPMWYNLLSNSTSTAEQKTLEKAAEHPGVNDGINAALISALMARRPGGFLNNILSLNGLLQMIYVPSLDPASGGQIKLLSKLFDDSENRNVKLIGSNGLLGERGALPMGRVLVTGLGDTEWGPFVQGFSGKPPLVANRKETIVVAYPETAVPGSKLTTVDLPPFLPFPISAAPYMKREGFAGGMRAKTTVGALSSAATSLAAYKRGALADLCKDYARNIYIDLALSSSQVTLSTDLDLSWQVGRHYSITATGKNGGTQFKGMLASCQHSAVISENSPSAGTQLVFSHVEMEGFELPSK